MKYFEVEYNGEHFRLQWDGEKTYNLQTLFEGEWWDYEFFHFYEVDEEGCECRR